MKNSNNLLQVEISQAINTVVENFLPRFTENKVMSVCVRTQASCFETKKEVNKMYWLLFYRPTNYTFVGYCEKEPHTKNGLTTDLEYLSYHDSCWREDGTSSKIREVANEIEKEFGENDDVSVFNTFGFDGFKILEGRVESNYKDRTAKFIAG